MPDLSKCLEAAVATGKINKQRADELTREIERHTGNLILRQGLSPEAAARTAQSSVLAAAQAKIKLAKRQKALQVIALHRLRQNIQSHPEGVGTGVMSTLVADITRKAGYENVDRRARAVTHELHRRFAEPMERLRTKTLGLTQDRELMRNMVRELFGVNTGNADAKLFAKAFSDTAEYARQRFNSAGGAIPKRSDWGMPQWHDAALVRKIPKNEWVETLIPLLDRSRMLDESGIPFSDMELRLALDSTYERIVSNGMSDLKPGTRGGSKLANRRQDSRFLVFKDGDAWLEYADRFGRPDLFSTLTDHLSGMAHDISLLEILGPNPDQAYKVMRDMARIDGVEGVRLKTMDNVYHVVSGKVDDTASVRGADISAAVRNWLTSARLGSAMLSAVSDLAFIRSTSAWTGLSSVSVLSRALSNLNPLNAEDRLFAVKLGLGAEAWATRALAANRFSEVTGAGWSARFADFTMRASGLSAWTDAAKKAFSMEFYEVLGSSARKGFDELDPMFKRELERFGFTVKDWELIRSTMPERYKELSYFSTENLLAREDIPLKLREELNNKIQGMVGELTLHAVPEPDARARALAIQGTSKGTLGGEAMRFVAQFKSFPISVILRHLYRGIYEDGAANKLSYLSGVIISSTVLGAVALQSKEISKGKDPRAMDSADFWGSAFLQGGGAGIYGDFLYAGMFGGSRFGQSLAENLLGPGVGLATDVARVSVGQFGDVLSDKDPKLAADMIRFTKSYLPGGSLWYGRLALERGIFDQLERLADPEAGAKFRAKQRKLMSDRGQRYWWRPGEISPDRGPQFSEGN